MRDVVERAASILVGVAAIGVSGVVVRREFADTVPSSRLATTVAPTYVSSWQSLLSAARISGEAHAPVVVVEFSDFECPFCRRFHSVLRTTQAKYPGKITVAFVHLPISSHRFARPAARAAECAHLLADTRVPVTAWSCIHSGTRFSLPC